MRSWLPQFRRRLSNASTLTMIQWLQAVQTALQRQEKTMSALSDAVTTIQADISALGTAIADVQTRVNALPTADDAADVAAAVSALGQAHTDLTSDAATLANIAVAPTTAG